MTGSEAWSIVAPILAQLVDKDDEFIDAYTTVYRALKKLDEEGGAECKLHVLTGFTAGQYSTCRGY